MILTEKQISVNIMINNLETNGHVLHLNAEYYGC